MQCEKTCRLSSISQISRVENMTNTINKFDPMGVCRTVIKAEYVFFSVIHGTFTKNTCWAIKQHILTDLSHLKYSLWQLWN